MTLSMVSHLFSIVGSRSRHSDYAGAEDGQFKEEKAVIIKQLSLLPDPEGPPQT